MKKILIIYATAGMGHKKAALAVKAALDELAPRDTEVSIIDAIDYTSDFVKWAYLKAYIYLVENVPTLWGLSYYLTNNLFFNSFARKIRKFSDWKNAKKLRDYVVQTQPDVIVTTHFFSSDLACDLKRIGQLRSRIITVVTDYRFHLWWVSPCTDIYVVGSERAKEDLVARHMQRDRIHVCGIPVDPCFSKQLDKKSILQKAGLRDGVPTMLVLGGGLGFGPIEAIVKIIDSIPTPTQTIAVCGHNKDLAKRLETLKPGLKKEIRIFGFVNNIHEYMGVSDILITKPGGITSTESLAKGLPIVIVNPIIGQETRNSEYLSSEGAALWIKKLSALKGALEKLITDPEKLQKMRASAEKLEKPNACYDIAKMAIALCTEAHAPDPACSVCEKPCAAVSAPRSFM